MRNQQQEPCLFQETWTLLKFLILLVHAWASTVQVFLRRPGTCGTKRFGMDTVFGWILAAFFPVFWEGTPGLVAQVVFSFLMLIMLVIHRFSNAKYRRHGMRIHSQFVGISRFQKQPGEKARKKALNDECTFCILVSFIAFVFSPALGVFIFIGGIANGVQDSLLTARDNRHLEQMDDAMIEQQYYAERFQKRWED